MAAFSLLPVVFLVAVVTMAIFVLSPLARMTRSAMLGVLSSDFVRTARAMGLSDRTIYVRYALRNALLPVLTTMGIVFSTMLGSKRAAADSRRTI